LSKLPIYQIIRRKSLRNAAQKRSPEERLGRTGIVLLALGVLSVLILIVVGGMLFALRTNQYPDVALLHTYFDPEQGLLLAPSAFYDRSGEFAFYTLAPPIGERSFLGYEEFSPELLRVTVAMVDPDYWSRIGFEEDAIPAQVVQRVLTPFDDDDVLMRYWLVGSVLFADGKEQVLAWYLNSSHYGMNTIGAEQASQLYLGKSAADLSLAEAALLAAVERSPALNPFDAPSAALENKDALLNELYDELVISETELESALAESIQLQPAVALETPQRVIALAMDTMTQEIPFETLLLGGYRVLTTVDADLQEQSECLMTEQLRRVNDPEYVIEPGVLNTCPAARYLTVLPPGDESALFAAVGSTVLLDPATSEVLAMVEQEDLITYETSLPQQPGTSLAPLIALTGFSHGESPATLRWDIPVDDPVEFTQYLAQDHTYHGPMRSREAIIQQDALVLAEWMAELGEGEVIRFSQAAGLKSLLSTPSSAQLLFTGGDVPLIEQAGAYAVFANLGVQYGVKSSEDHLQPQVVLNVFAPGDELVLLDCTTKDSQILVGNDLAYLVHDVLADEVMRRSEYGFPNPLSIGYPVGGLLSNSDGGRQRWAFGYTTRFVAGVWLGTDTDNPLPEKSAGNVWYALMTYAMQGLPAEGWDTPENIITMTVCSPSGLLPTVACQQLVNETFIEGNQPVQLDNLYQSFAINRETGRLATIFTPLSLVDEKIFLVVPPEAQEWAEQNGLPVPPEDYDTIQQVTASPDASFTLPENFSYVSGEVTIRGTAAGEDFSSYTLLVGEGLNPKRWIVIHEETDLPVTDDVLGIWNTEGYEGLYALRLVVEREGQQLESTLLQVTVDNIPPELSILTPQPAEDLLPNSKGEVVFQARPTDNLGVREVRWYVDGDLFAVRQQAPYSAFLQLASGDYLLEVEAVDQAGNLTRSEPLSFSILD
jgi:membrane peptidoglycan carboxypeptidase